jgi:hypothetical protein
MRPATGLGPAAPDNDRTIRSGSDDDGANRRIGPGPAEATPAERQRQVHEAGIIGAGDGHGRRKDAGCFA